MSADWTENAACRGENSDLWFVENRELNDEAKRICVSCPVKRQCLEGALERREQFGIWAGRRFGKLERQDYEPPAREQRTA